METIKLCPKCAAKLPADAPAGLCPKCLLQAGFESQSGAGANPTAGFVPPEPAELAKHFPQLEIMEMLGAGGMGVVYKARQVALDRVVALKILPPNAGSDPAFAERFAREARALAKLSHPNIVGIFDFGQAGPYYYFLMEFVDGVNLRQMISTQRVEPRQALAIVPQICDALQYAHDQGIVHRDIKPENLLMDRRGRIRIADFGLARLLGPTADVRLTQSQHVMGTPHYMAPEQLEHPLTVDHRADIYSLGVVLYEMLTGELPIGRFELPSHKVQVDVRLDEIVLKTLAKEPERRYQHASDVKSEMETLAGVPLSQLPPGLRNVLGVEYKSRTTIFGWPLLHVSMGFDPNTGRQRHARGIIAVGGRATGVLAIGGFAKGIIAYGGCAIGVVAIGGVALGVLGMGGAVLALMLAWGGLALSGGVAYGGLALGFYACGGYAMGVHAVGSTGGDKAALQFFKPWFKPWVNAIALIVLLLPTVLQALIIGWAKQRTRASVPPMERTSHPPRFSRTAILGALLAALFPLSLLMYLTVSDRQRPAPVSVSVQTDGTNAPAAAVGNVPAPQPAPFTDAAPKLILATMGLAGLLAPLLTTACGIIAISQIRRSNGGIFGLPLAVLDALLFPVLLLNALLIAGGVMVGGNLGRQTGAILGGTAGALLGLALSVAIVVVTWRLASKPATPAQPT